MFGSKINCLVEDSTFFLQIRISLVENKFLFLLPSLLSLTLLRLPSFVLAFPTLWSLTSPYFIYLPSPHSPEFLYFSPPHFPYNTSPHFLYFTFPYFPFPYFPFFPSFRFPYYPSHISPRLPNFPSLSCLYNPSLHLPWLPLFPLLSLPIAHTTSLSLICPFFAYLLAPYSFSLHLFSLTSLPWIPLLPLPSCPLTSHHFNYFPPYSHLLISHHSYCTHFPYISAPHLPYFPFSCWPFPYFPYIPSI